MITINFASRNYRLVGRIRTGLIFGSFILAALSAALLWTGFALRENISSIELKLRALETEDEQVKPLLLEREQLVKDLTAMSGLMESRKVSWTGLLTSIEAVVPVGVALKQVDFKPKDAMLTLDGMAQSPEALRNLIVGMEKNASFKEPLLKHQSLEKGNISFNVVAIYREEQRPAMALGKR